MLDDTSTLVVQFRDAGAAAGLKGLQTELRNTATATGAAGRALPSFYQGAEQAGLKAAGAERGVRRLEYAMTAMAAESLGAERGIMGAASRAVEAGILFGYGSEAVLTIGAGFAAFGIVAKALDAPLAKVTADADALSKTYDKLTSSLHPSVAALSQVVDVARQLEQAQEDAKPNFWEQLFGTGLFGALGGGPLVEDRLTAQRTFAQSAEATAKTLRPVLGELRAIGHTKDLLRDVADQMSRIGEIGGAGVRHVPAQLKPGLPPVFGFDPKFTIPAHDEVTGTGLIGAQQAAVARARGMGWSQALTDATVEGIDRDFVTRVGAALKTAGDQLTPIPVLTRMAEQAAAAVRASGVGKAIAEPLVAQIRENLLGAITAMQHGVGVEGLFPGIRGAATNWLRRRGLAPLEFQAPSAARSAALALGVGGPQGGTFDALAPDALAQLGRMAVGGLSSVNNVKAQDDAARAAAELARQLALAAQHTEKFDVTLVGAIGAAVAAFSSGTPEGILGGAGGLLSTLAQAPKAGLESLSLPGAILGVLGGLIGLGGHGPQRVVVSSYEAAAMQQMKTIMDQLGTLVSVIITNDRGEPLPDIAYNLNRLTRRDAKPRIPLGVG